MLLHRAGLQGTANARGPRLRERTSPSTAAAGHLHPYLQVLNAFNRRNVLFYFHDFDKTPATRSGISMFPVLPTIGFEASF